MLGFLLDGFVMVPCLKASFAWLSKSESLFCILPTTPYSIWNCIKFCALVFSTCFDTHLCSFVVMLCCKRYCPCHCITLWSIIVLSWLVVFHIALYNIWIEGYVWCWLGFQLLAIHCSTIFVSWLEANGNNSLCVSFSWFEFVLVMSYNLCFVWLIGL